MINLTRLWTGESQPADHLRYGRGHTAAASASARRPIVVWNITRTCNLRCIHCYSDSTACKYPGELTWDQMRAVVDDLVDYRVPSLLLSGGEPMVHSHFFDLVDYASARGLKLTISTNGTLIDLEKAVRLKLAKVAYVGISLDGIGGTHDHFRGKQGAFDAAVKGFENCHKVHQKTGLRLTLTRHNVDHLEGILDFIEDSDIKRVCFYHLVPSGRGKELEVLPSSVAQGAIDTLIERIERWDMEGQNRELLTVTQPADGAYLLQRMIQENHPNLDEAKALLTWNGGGANSSGRGIANIDTQGGVHPDQFWQDIDLGNVKETPFSKIWEAEGGGSAAQLHRIRLLSQLSPLELQTRLEGACSGCGWFSVCGGGFRSRAAIANGDLWSSDPGCYLDSQEAADMALF